MNVDTFIRKVKKYTEISELSCDVVRELISRIVVHQAVKENGHKTQEIDILFNGLDNVDLFSTEKA